MGRGEGSKKRPLESEATRGSSRSAEDYLDDILTAISKIEEYTTGVTEAEFLGNSEKQDAVSRRLQIIGEAAKYIPRALREKRPEIPWTSVVGLRNVLSHAYQDEDPKVIWRTVQTRLHPLRDAVRYLLTGLSESSDH